MNLKTTLFLAILVGGGATTAWFLNRALTPPPPDSTTLKFLKEDLVLDRVTRVSLAKGDTTRFTLERNGPEWSLPGKWPVRTQDVDSILTALTTLRSRFAPVPLEANANLGDYGLGDGAVTVKVKLGDKEHTLTIGEKADSANRYSRATYLRLDNEQEVVRLAPGLIAELDRPQEFLQQRRLFPPERVAKEDDSKEKVEQVQAQEIRVQTPEGKFTIAKQGKDWTLSEPTTDRVDLEKLKTILTGLPDFWADKFVETKDKKLADFGLEKPEFTFTITRQGGAATKLLIGKISDTKEKVVMRPGPPGQFGMPGKPIPQFIKEEYRYAKLADNDQVFEIKTDKLKDVAVKLEDLRDPLVARFKTDDVRRVEIVLPKETLVMVKDKDKWKFEKPVTLDAESQPITELLDKLSGLRATDKDVRDGVDPKTVGLEKPHAVIKLALEEGKSDDKDKKKREVVFNVGTNDKEKGKLFIRVDGWPRVNAIADDLLKLVDRPVLAYRNRKVLELAAADLAKIDIVRAGEEYTLEKKDGAWQLTKPAATKAEASKADQLAGDLTRLETTEFIADAPKEEDLDKVYGLAKPTLRVTFGFADAKKPAQTLVIGNQRAGKDEWYARLDKGSVFVVKKDVREAIDRESLAYRPLQLWQFPTDDVQEIRIQKDGNVYVLSHKDKKWTISGPFDATATPQAVEAIGDEVARLKGEKFIAHAAKELDKFGLDKPYLSVEVVAKGEKETKKHRLLIGKPVEKDEKNRYAQVAGDGAIFTLNEKTVSALAKDALDLLDKDLLTVSPRSIQRVQAKGAVPFTLEQKKDDWFVVGSPAPAFKAEDDAVQNYLRPWSRLRAERIAGYGGKIDWKHFGLDQPAAQVTVSILEGDKDKKTVEHVLALGKDAGNGQRFARLDQQNAVAVLDAAAAADLAKSHLDFVNHKVLKYDLDAVAGIVRQMKDGDLELVKRDDQWRFAKPDRQADDPTVNEVLENTFRLKAKRIAAYPAADLAKFGLDAPEATVTLKLADPTGAPKSHVIKIGKAADEPGKPASGERYALVDKGESVIVLSADLAKHLVAPPLHFADRNVANFGGADGAMVERGPRKLSFTKTDNLWKLTAPLKADAEDAAIEDLVKDLRRLRADEIVAEKVDPKTYEFDRPAAVWTLTSGGKDVLALIVGKTEETKDKAAPPRRFAKLAKGDAVYLLNAKLSAKVLEEYRSRKPWSSLDAVQVEQLSYAGPAPFTLKKDDKDWNVVGMPAAKVNAKAVTDTLDGLASLKAERWLVDDKADLQLFGLQPPQLTIDLQTATGKRSLLIGRNEKDSRRVYAAIAGETAVFVIAEEDARRILRPLADFVEKK